MTAFVPSPTDDYARSINLDFADIKSIMEDKGKAIMGTGEAEGEDRRHQSGRTGAVQPLLDDSNMKVPKAF